MHAVSSKILCRILQYKTIHHTPVLFVLLLASVLQIVNAVISIWCALYAKKSGAVEYIPTYAVYSLHLLHLFFLKYFMLFWSETFSWSVIAIICYLVTTAVKTFLKIFVYTTKLQHPYWMIMKAVCIIQNSTDIETVKNCTETFLLIQST